MVRISNQMLLTLEPRHWEYMETHIKEGGKNQLIRNLLDEHINNQGINPEEVELRREQYALQRQELSIRKKALYVEEQKLKEKEEALVDYIEKYEEAAKQREAVWPEFEKALKRAISAVQNTTGNRDHVCRVRAEMLSNTFGESYRRVSFEELLKLANGNSTLEDFKV